MYYCVLLLCTFILAELSNSLKEDKFLYTKQIWYKDFAIDVGALGHIEFYGEHV